MNFRRRDRNGDDNYEFYEDTHNERGEYIGKRSEGKSRQNSVGDASDGNANKCENIAMPMGNGQRIIVYYPKTPEDVEVVINYLKLNNPAVINLEDKRMPDDIKQRILDFFSGAVCALSGSVHRISGNMFLLSPKDVEITIPYEQK